MPFVDIRVIEGVFTHDEKRDMVERVSNAMFEVEGDNLRDATHVVITETPSGEWAVAGEPLTAEDVKRKRTAGWGAA